MAIQTANKGYASDSTTNTIAELQVDFDDVSMRLTAVRIVNPTAFAMYAVVRRGDGSGQTYTLSAPAGQTVEQVIPGQAANRLGVTIDANGRLDGVEYHFGFGSPP
jgi:hypothetical protein